MALVAAHLNAGHSGGDSVATVGIYSPSSPTSIPPPPPPPHSPFSPSLISLMVSVDVKHHVYLLTFLQLHLPALDLSWALLKVQHHLPPLDLAWTRKWQSNFFVRVQLTSPLLVSPVLSLISCDWSSPNTIFLSCPGLQFSIYFICFFVELRYGMWSLVQTITFLICLAYHPLL